MDGDEYVPRGPYRPSVLVTGLHCVSPTLPRWSALCLALRAETMIAKLLVDGTLSKV